jgi:hypothetical protein
MNNFSRHFILIDENKMASIKLDLETRFKWPKHSGEPLTPENDKKLKKSVQFKYVELLNGLLHSFKLAPCSGELDIFTDLIIGNRKFVGKTNPLFGTYTYPQMHSAIENSSFELSSQAALKELVDNIWVNLSIQFDIENIKKKFRECSNESLFVVSLTTIPVRKVAIGEPYIGHANILVIAKNRGIVFWIEPQTTIDSNYEARMIESIKKLVTDIGMVDPTVINPVEVCPQAITNDEDCMFWAYTIFLLIMLNPQERDHNILIKRFMEKYPTKEALTKYIDGFKQALLSFAISAGFIGAKRSRKRRLYKKRKTYRKKNYLL